MPLHLREFYVKGDSRPPSQSPMRVEKLSANGLCLRYKSAPETRGAFWGLGVM